MGKELAKIMLSHTTEGALGHYTLGMENVDAVGVRLRELPEDIPANVLVSRLSLKHFSRR
jgi:hypothetical protein